MRRNVVIVIGVSIVSFLFVVAVTYHYFGKKKVSDEHVENKLEKAPNFDLPNSKGENVSLEDVKSKIKIINFWASWSPYSKNELLDFSKIKNEFGNDVAVVALDRDTNINDGKKFLEHLDLNEDIVFVYDKNDEYFKKTKGFAVPETLFLNEKEEIVFHKHGPMTYDEMRLKVEEMLK
jgi:thiol-disulfide isomerase/thioredoxin